MSSRLLAASLLVFGGIVGLVAQTRQQLPITNEEWTRPFPPLRVVGNLYYVGTYDLAAYLITTSEGNVLINTGVGSSVPMIGPTLRPSALSSATLRSSWPPMDIGITLPEWRKSSA